MIKTMKIVWDNRFKRAFRKLIKKNPEMSDRIINVLNLLSIDPLTPSLKLITENFCIKQAPLQRFTNLSVK